MSLRRPVSRFVEAESHGSILNGKKGLVHGIDRRSFSWNSHPIRACNRMRKACITPALTAPPVSAFFVP
jgi:hypothetical protein